MPELPEVETTLRGIEAHVVDHRVTRVVVREKSLRWPVTAEIHEATGQTCLSLRRRGKYLLFEFEHGGLIVHLGMSGSLRVLDWHHPVEKHDHVELVLDETRCLRFNDPRRFGAFLWTRGEMAAHPLIKGLGPEPLSPSFSADYLYVRSRSRRVAIKNFIMNGRIVVGVGNIYASEALFMAGIHPKRQAGRIAKQRYGSLVSAIRDVLESAIRKGGTTLRDYVGSDGAPGYFAQDLLVYGRSDQPCFQCGANIHNITIGQRSSFFCPVCQT